MKRSIDEFTNLYSLSKTLRFELKPVGETAEKLKEFKNEALKAIVARDERRAEEYKQVKRIIDDYHRFFIEEILSGEIISKKDIKTAFGMYLEVSQTEADKDKVKNYDTHRANMRKDIAKRFSDKSGKKHYALFDKELFGGAKKQQGKLVDWLDKKLESGEYTEEEYNEKKALVESFIGFTTYFTGFHENRKNMYKAEEQSTAIGYRTVDINMIKHFSNCVKFELIKNNYKDLWKKLSDYKDIFKPESFVEALSQSGIDKYNTQIGRSSKGTYEEGVNQIINLYRQKHCDKNSKTKPPFMTQLYKQILSESDKIFTIDEYKKDEEVLSDIKDYCDEVLFKDNIDVLKNLLGTEIKTSNLDKIFIKRDSLTGISNKLYGDWSILGAAISKYAEERFSGVIKEKWLKGQVVSLAELQDSIDIYCAQMEEIASMSIADYFSCMKVKIRANGKDEQVDIVESINIKYQECKEILSGDVFKEGGKNRKVEKVKAFLDAVLELIHFVKPLQLMKSGKYIEVPDKDSSFYNTFDEVYNNLSDVIGLYNKVRNYVAKKPYSTEKFKVNFENNTLLDGWDVNKETDNTCVLLLKDNKYYLGIMSRGHTGIFNYRKMPADSDGRAREKEELRKTVLAHKSESNYNKVVYKLLPDPSKMLPKVFFSQKNIDTYKPTDEIKNIREKGLFKKEAKDKRSLIKWIDFLKKSLDKHPEWSIYFNFNFKKTKEYEDISQFYRDVAEQGYCITFDKINSNYINEKVSKGELYLFEIYNKDFSSYSKGKPNLHTSYWKLLFSKENLKDVVLKLNGQAEVFFRPASLKKKNVAVHKANKPIDNKNPLNHKKKSSFEYDIVKDRRYTQDKLFFHCPITLNFKSGGFGRFNERVCQFLIENPEICIIGIDRGERHLLYYTITDQSGKILEQGSLNSITNSLTSEGEEIDKTTNYHELLNEKEKGRDAARKSWTQIENIKELKSGYLSHVVHKLAKLMIKYNAIVCLEDLNFGFKRGRIKVEKQVYQKFEKALIDKLNYLVFKDEKSGKAGHYLKAYQLTAPFESFSKLGKQSGFLFYVASHYTSKIDPVTGFASFINMRYENMAKSKKFFSNIDSIKYNSDKDYFEFEIDYKKVGQNKGGQPNWTVCTHGKERYRYDKKTRNYKCYDVTEELKKLFEDNGLAYMHGEDIREAICQIEKAGFFKSLHFWFGLVLQLRHGYKDGEVEKDYILSPVADATGKFFDSREYEEMGESPLPKDADANGAYNIARKGLLLLEQINENGKPGKIDNKSWFEFVQSNNN